jgi:GNAT superfamily N-acetyltransferase
MLSSLRTTAHHLTMTIRAAQIADARQIAEVHVATWRDAYRGILPDSLLDSLSVEKWTELWQDRLSAARETTNLVLVLDDQIVGWVALGPARDSDVDPRRTQQVYGIYLDSRYWAQGHGKALYLVAEDRMRQNGAIDAVLWVLRDNLRARRFYGARGFALDPAGTERHHNGDPSIVEVRYRKKL